VYPFGAHKYFRFNPLRGPLISSWAGYYREGRLLNTLAGNISANDTLPSSSGEPRKNRTMKYTMAPGVRPLYFIRNKNDAYLAGEV
jgi:hypothetical protein